MINSDTYLREADDEELRAELKEGPHSIFRICHTVAILTIAVVYLHFAAADSYYVHIGVGGFLLFQLWYLLRVRSEMLRLLAARVEKERILTYVQDKKKQLEQTNLRLREAQVVADSANKAKSRFLAKVSHELRTPLNAIIGMNDIAMEISTEEEVAECLNEVKSSASGFLDLINDVLDISKIESGTIEVQERGFSHSTLIQHVISLTKAISHRKKIDFHAEIDDDIPEYLVGDVVKIRQVLVNLLGNAVKYSPINRSVHLRMSRVEPDPRTGCIRIRYSIRDHGVGMNKHLKAHIANALLQDSASHPLGTHGGGLGLSLSAFLVSLMGGEFSFTSEEGRGSEFVFILPFTEALQAEIEDVSETTNSVFGPRSSTEPITEQQTRVLVVEDNLINKKVISHFLQKNGFEQLRFAENGEEALSLFKAESFDIILMDCQMPVMDGYTATRAIRLMEQTQGVAMPVPIVAVTAQAMVGDRERCLQSGMNDVVTKPIDRGLLLATIRKHLSRGEREDEHFSSGLEESLSSSSL